jgi:hypothetical protein
MISDQWWYISTPRFSCSLRVDEQDIIRECAPIFSRFVGQPRRNLWTWVLRRFNPREVYYGKLDGPQ